MDHQQSPEPETWESGEGDGEEEEASDLENGTKEDKQNSSPAKLFTFSVVNSYGTANISPLPCDGNILKLNRKSEICRNANSARSKNNRQFPPDIKSHIVTVPK